MFIIAHGLLEETWDICIERDHQWCQQPGGRKEEELIIPCEDQRLSALCDQEGSEGHLTLELPVSSPDVVKKKN